MTASPNVLGERCRVHRNPWFSVPSVVVIFRGQSPARRQTARPRLPRDADPTRIRRAENFDADEVLRRRLKKFTI